MEYTGAQIIVDVLGRQGVDTVFGYPGGAVLDLYDALFENTHGIRHITTCHEQAAAHAADGYARATGRVGVVIATSGPGATNLVTGIAAAYLDSSPVVVITGNVAKAVLGSDAFQEVDITGITMPVTKHNFIVQDAARLADTLREAFVLAQSGRPGPVLVDIPKDIQAAAIQYTPQEAAQAQPPAPADAPAIRRAAKAIRAAKRPFVLVGGGVALANAGKHAAALSRLIDAAVGTTLMGLAAVPFADSQNVGMIGMHGKPAANEVLRQSDCVIALGTRFSDRATACVEDWDAKTVVHMDIDAAEIGKNVQAQIAVVGDVRESLPALCQALAPKTRALWQREVARIAGRYPPAEHSDELTPANIMHLLNDYVGSDCLICTDVGQHQMWVAQHYAFSRERSLITSGGLGAMGFGMGAAMGARLGCPDRRTVLVTGDGSFHMNAMELATAVAEGMQLLVLVMNNGTLGLVRQLQDENYAGRHSATEPVRRTDFAALAKSMGANGFVAGDMDGLRQALIGALASAGPSVIDCAIAAEYTA